MKESTRNYWNQVGSKLLGISKVLLDMSVPVAVEIGINKVCNIIDEKLHDMYRNTIMNSLITLVLNISGMLIVLFNPFGLVLSKYFAALFFIVSKAIFLVRLIQYFHKYGKETFFVSKSIMKNKSISKGIENYVYTQFPAISMAYTGISLAACYLPALSHIPSLNKTIKYFIQIFWKKIAVYGLIVAVYSISVYWIAKPILLKQMAGIDWYEIYFYPIYHTVSLFF